MKNPTGKKLEKIIFKLFDDASQGVDKYNHNGSLWVIFTNEMRWVVEFTKNQTLWYNYNFFKGEMDLIGLDCVEDKDLIQKWFESRFLDINPVEDTIQNGVKDISSVLYKELLSVEDTIQNGVKDTRRSRLINLAATQMVEDTIQNGVKHTDFADFAMIHLVEDTIQNGVKHTRNLCVNRVIFVEDAIQKGVKNTRKGNPYFQESVEDTIQNGVKQTEFSKRDFFPKDIIQDGLKINGTYVGGKRQKENVENIIKNGVKHIEDGDWLDGDERIEGIIQEGVKETNQDCSDNIARVEGIIRIGEKIS